MEDPPAARSFLTHTKLAELTKGKQQEVVVLRQDTTVDLALRVGLIHTCSWGGCWAPVSRLAT